MGERVVPRLRELAPLPRPEGVRRRDSRNLGTTLLPGSVVTVSVLGVGRLHLDGVVHLEGREIAFGGRRPQQRRRT